MEYPTRHAPKEPRRAPLGARKTDTVAVDDSAAMFNNNKKVCREPRLQTAPLPRTKAEKGLL